MAGRKRALNPMVVYSTDRSKAVVPELVLLFVALCFIYEAICFMFYRVTFFCSCVFQSFYHSLDFSLTFFYSTDRSKAVVPVLVLLFVALWFILRGDLFYVLPCVILFLCFSVLLTLRLPRLGKRELVLALFVRLFDLRLFGFVCFLFLLVSGKGCGICDCGLPWTFLLPVFGMEFSFNQCGKTDTSQQKIWL